MLFPILPHFFHPGNAFSVEQQYFTIIFARWRHQSRRGYCTLPSALCVYQVATDVQLPSPPSSSDVAAPAGGLQIPAMAEPVSEGVLFQSQVPRLPMQITERKQTAQYHSTTPQSFTISCRNTFLIEHVFSLNTWSYSCSLFQLIVLLLSPPSERSEWRR